LVRLDRRAEADGALAAARALIEAGDYGFLHHQDQALWEELASASRTARVPAALAFELLGPFTVRQGGVVLDQWPRRKARVLLAALALRPDGVRADELAEIVGHGEAHPANVLRVNAWALRRVLEPQLARGEASRYLIVQGDRYRLAPELVARVDLAEFEADLAAAEPLKDGDPREAARLLERAMGRVRGALLDEDGPFAVFEREREAFRRRCTTTLHWLGAHYRSCADYMRAEVALERAIALAPSDEEAYLAAMRLYRARGQDDRVRRAYWDCRRALKTHQGLTPSEAFEAAYRALVAAGVKKK
jgi:DNA-binding SARP family transcriptional activator